MKTVKISPIVLIVAALLLAAVVEPTAASPYFMLCDEDWAEALDEGQVAGMDPNDWDDYWLAWQDPNEGEPYPHTTYYEPELYFYEPDCYKFRECRGTDFNRDGITDIQDFAKFVQGWLSESYDYSFLNGPGLVMAWGPSEQEPNNSTSSAWVYTYGEDPNLTNTFITLTMLFSNRNVNKISIGLVDASVNRMAWHWNVCGAGYGNQFIIDTDLTGIDATSPRAIGYFQDPGFDITKVQSLFVTGSILWSTMQVPPPGKVVKPWGCLYDVIVSPGDPPPAPPPPGIDPTAPYTKWKQPPNISIGNKTTMYGWDEPSLDHQIPLLADDWACMDDRPVVKVRWWGSFPNWRKPSLPLVVPVGFHIGFWTDQPANPSVLSSYSHPDTMIFEQYCGNYQTKFVGFDVDPHLSHWDRVHYQDSCFEFSCNLNPYFVQDPNNNDVYWLSIAAVYSGPPPQNYLWGWKTRIQFWNDVAVRMNAIQSGGWPPTLGSQWSAGAGLMVVDPLVAFPSNALSWDMTFELISDRP